MTTANPIPLVVPSGKGRVLNVLGHQATRKLTTHETGGSYFVFELVSPPGLGVPSHVHKREDEILWVVDGEFEVTLGERSLNVGGGTVLYLPRRVPHGFTNVGTRRGKTVFTVVPGASFEKFFDELAALPSEAPDMARVAAIFAKYGMEVLPQPEKSRG